MASRGQVLIMGGSGFIGRCLAKKLKKHGYDVSILTRKERSSFEYTQFEWDGKIVPKEALENLKAVINLVGEPIADKAWSAEQKIKILDSRIESVKALKEGLDKVSKKPEIIIQVSAIGFYGARDKGEPCSESSPCGEDFLAEVCKKWEEAAQSLNQNSDVRLVIPRVGLVFGKGGGVFPKLSRLYTFGFGATLGSGRQWMNWIHVQDLVNFFLTTIEDSNFKGIYNLVSPLNIRNEDFHVLFSSLTMSFRKMKVPSFLIRFFLGERSDLILHGPKVLSTRLNEARFTFLYDSPKKTLKSFYL